MPRKLLSMLAGAGLCLAAAPVLAAQGDLAEDPSPLIRAEPLGSIDYAVLVAGLQDKIDRANLDDQDWIRKLWTWICYILNDILQDPRVALYVKIEYWTTTAAGDRIPVTGLAILPQAQGTHPAVPMISFQHPTQVERRFSPSMFNMTNMWDDAQFTVPFGTIFAQAGFAVVLADYPGMGSNTNAHPYCTESLANSVVDMIRATRDHMKTNAAYARWDSRLYLTGYSEGGYATVMAARDLQVRYAAEFTNVLGVAGLDGPYSLSDTMRQVMLTAGATFTSPYFLPYTINGYDSVYAALDPVFVFTNAVKASVPTEADFARKLQEMCLAGTNTGTEINSLIYKATPYEGPRSILTGAYLAGLSNTASVLNQVLASNDAYHAWTPQMKMRLYHYPNDDLVPYGNSTNAYNAFKGRSAPQTELVAFGNQWPLSALIEWLKSKMGSYHGAAAPVACVASIIWLHDLAYGKGINPQFPPNDIDGDGITDLVLYDESSGTWQVMLSNQAKSWRAAGAGEQQISFAQIALGGPGQAPLLSDFDGDGKADPAVYQAATGLWILLLSWFDYLPVIFPLGGGGAVPVPQDYDGDRISDACVYNAGAGSWTVFLLTTDQLVSLPFGGPGFTPARGDFDGDRKADPALYRAADGLWSVALSASGYSITSVTCGGNGYAPMPADYDGDGKTDICVYRQADGRWQLCLSGSGYVRSEFSFGGPGIGAVTGDFGANGKAGILLYREETGIWSGILSVSGYTDGCWSFGGPGFTPVP